MPEHKEYYKKNNNYASFLEELPVGTYSKYLDHILKLQPISFLDVGCGVGTVVEELTKYGVDAHGIDVSDLFIDKAKEKKGTYSVYDGEKIPYEDGYFDCVGSFTVLEHVEDPELFLKEQVRVLKPGGYIIVACPSFCGVVSYNSHHWRNKGLRRTSNFVEILKKKVNSYLNKDKMEFGKMDPIIKEKFTPDDDAICITNATDIGFFLQKYGVKRVHLSGVIYSRKIAIELLSRLPFIRSLTGMVFYVGQKSLSKKVY